jgi:hypothetical protein
MMASTIPPLSVWPRGPTLRLAMWPGGHKGAQTCNCPSGRVGLEKHLDEVCETVVARQWLRPASSTSVLQMGHSPLSCRWDTCSCSRLQMEHSSSVLQMGHLSLQQPMLHASVKTFKSCADTALATQGCASSRGSRRTPKTFQSPFGSLGLWGIAHWGIALAVYSADILVPPRRQTPAQCGFFRSHLLMICAAKPRYTAAAAREHERVFAPRLPTPA